MSNSNTINQSQPEVPTIEMIEKNTIDKIDRANVIVDILSKMAVNHGKTIEFAKNKILIIEKKLDLNKPLFEKIGSYEERLNKLNMKAAKLNEKLENKTTRAGVDHQISNDKINEIKASIQRIEATKNKIEEKIAHFSKKIGENRDDVFLEKSYLKNSIEKIDLNFYKRIKTTSKYEGELKSIFSDIDYTVDFLNKIKERSELPIGDENKIKMFDKDKKIILNLDKLHKSLVNDIDLIDNKGIKIQEDTKIIDERNKDIYTRISSLNKSIDDFNKNAAGNTYSPNINIFKINTLINCIGTLNAMEKNSQSSDLSIKTCKILTFAVGVTKH